MELSKQDIRLKLYSLKRHKRSSSWGMDKPYLWLIYFKMDGEVVKITPEFRLSGEGFFKYSEGSHGNLGIKSMEKEELIQIPEKIGLWQTTFEPLTVPYFEASVSGMMGVMIILMEQNNVSGEGAEAGHQALNDYFKENLNGLIRNFDPKQIDVWDFQNSIGEYFASGSKGFARKMGAAVGNAIKGNQSLVRNVWSLVNTDNMIGFTVRRFSLPQLIKKQHMNFSKKWETEKFGSWEIFGEISATPSQPGIVLDPLKRTDNP